jgi:hypothetical protein
MENYALPYELKTADKKYELKLVQSIAPYFGQAFWFF